MLGAVDPVCSVMSGRDRALGHSVHAVILTAVELPKAVPVNRCAVVLERILDVDDQSVTPICLESRANYERSA
jgi:hypothetical protein